MRVAFATRKARADGSLLDIASRKTRFFRAKLSLKSGPQELSDIAAAAAEPVPAS